MTHMLNDEQSSTEICREPPSSLRQVLQALFCAALEAYVLSNTVSAGAFILSKEQRVPELHCKGTFRKAHGHRTFFQVTETRSWRPSVLSR